MKAGDHSAISRNTFILGLVVTALASVLLSTLVSIHWAVVQGPKGDKGEQGPQGPQGEPGPSLAFARWNVSWRAMNETLEWGEEVGTSVLSSTFDYDWGVDVIFSQHSDYIGFEAAMTVNMQRDGQATFSIGSDDGSELYVDGIRRIDNWGSSPYNRISISVALSRGFHRLVLTYYDLTGPARVSFDCDPDLLFWHD